IKNNTVKNLQYEAFILNEMCHYSGAFCSSLHCDELAHLCKMPYDLVKINRLVNNFPEVDKKLELYYDELEKEILYFEDENEERYTLGSTGCGICKLKKLKEAGVTHLKVVGRGKYIDDMEKDIIGLKKAISMLENIDYEEFEKDIKDKLFKNGCSGECYY
ncbi:MAG: U32 family peptidase, partial [Clostridium saudiense]|nr:U32 family peptidase [Clostridium saudiense]